MERRVSLIVIAVACAIAGGVSAMDGDVAGVRTGLFALAAPDYGYGDRPVRDLVPVLLDPEATPAQPEPPGPGQDENVVDQSQQGPVEPPKPTILRSIFTNWKGEIRFGFELSSGNNDRTRFRGGFDIHKRYWGHKTAISTDYIVANNNQGESENRLVSRFTQDWGTGGTKWSSVYIRVDGDADRFQDYDYRTNVSAGAKYQFVKNDKTDINGRLGVSVRREFGGPNTDIVPEGSFSVFGSHRINDTQRVKATLDYYPEIEQPSRYRINATGDWDIDIDPEAGLGLRLRVQNRYDARPSRRPERNDFDFSVYLIWNF